MVDVYDDDDDEQRAVATICVDDPCLIHGEV